MRSTSKFQPERYSAHNTKKKFLLIILVSICSRYGEVIIWHVKTKATILCEVMDTFQRITMMEERKEHIIGQVVGKVPFVAVYAFQGVRVHWRGVSVHTVTTELPGSVQMTAHFVVELVWLLGLDLVQ